MNIITDTVALEAMVESIRTARVMTFDVETMGEHRGDPWRNDVVWIALSDGSTSWVVPMGHPNGDFVEIQYALKNSADLTERLGRGLQPRKSDYSTDIKKATIVFTDPPAQLTRTEVFSALKPLFFDDTILKIGHNLAFDLGSVAKYIGGVPVGPYFDTMIAAFLIDSTRAYGYGLKDVSKKYAGIDMEKGVGAMIEKHSFDEVAKYAWLDADATTKVWKAMVPMIERDDLTRVMNLEMDVLPVVTQMRLTGATIDTDALLSLRKQLETDIEKAKSDVFRIAGKKFNLNSNTDKQAMLFGDKKDGGRGLKPVMLTPKGKDKKRNKEALSLSDYSVAADALEIFRGQDVLVDAMLQYADLNKLHSTYVVPYLGGVTTRIVNGKVKQTAKAALLDKGRLHTDFNQIGAATGRMSSRNPNLQNVPNASTAYGQAIRNLFIAPPGAKVITADYSQIEPRIIASFSKDPVMLETYRTGGDIYTAVGETMGVDRKAGKVLVLSIAYGVGPDKIASQIGCSVEEARELLEDFSDKFKNVGRLKALSIRTALKRSPTPFVVTMAGRRRYIPELLSSERWLYQKGERQAFNTVIQGSAADVMKIAMVRAHQMIPEGADLILTVHDELVTLAPDHLVEETVEAIREAMEGIQVLRVPLVAEVHAAPTWGEGKN
jgi:DNA polymerase I-like protein with 3'-5' exonuclease and polymerase domains